MPKFIMLVGLPGSGKSFWGNQSGFRFFDDITQQRFVGLNALADTKADETVVISDYCLIMQEYRNAASAKLGKMFSGCEIEWVYWEKDFEQCWKNVLQRAAQGDGRIVSRAFLRRSAEQYKIPLGVTPRPVYR